MKTQEIIDIEDSIRDIDGVNKVLCIDDVIGTTIPFEILPDNVIGKVKNGDSTLVMVTFNESTSNSKTLDAIEEIRTLMNGKAKVGGMSAIVLDTMNLSNKEVIFYLFSNFCSFMFNCIDVIFRFLFSTCIITIKYWNCYYV